MKIRKATLMLCLCAGAGLKPIEVAGLLRSDILCDQEGVLVTVRGVNPRRIPLLAEWEPFLRQALAGIEPAHLVFGSATRTQNRNVLNGFVGTTVGADHPRSDRLRATWLVTHLSAGTRMKELMQAAGISKFENASRYLEFIPALNTADYRKLLRLELKP